jgi:hypothetical protein
MSARTVAECLAFGIAGTIFLWNVVFAPPGCAISDVIVRWSRAGGPLVPFLFGMLMGHLFWPLHLGR